MKELAISLLTQYVVPILVTVLWFTLATVIATVLGKKTQILGWAERNPRAALLVQICRRTGIDFWGLLGALRQYAENKATQPRNSRKLTLGSMVFFAALLVGCAGTFDESRLAHHAARKATPVKISTSERCIQLSDRARLEGALAKGGAVLTGASGLSTIPFDGEGERIALAGTTVLLAGGTALVMFLQESDAAAYIAEGCAQ